jgi:hypothetical protein
VTYTGFKPLLLLGDAFTFFRTTIPAYDLDE